MISKPKEIFKWWQLIFSLAIKDLKIKYLRATGGFDFIGFRHYEEMFVDKA